MLPADDAKASRYKDAFKTTARYYSRYRRPYPSTLFELLIQKFQLDGKGRLLDLGCGTGQLTVPLSRHFEEAVGMDPEPEMLVEASTASKEAGTEVRWIRAESDDLDRLRPQLGTFRLVTIGGAFHWMDREAALRTLDRMITPSGGIAVIGCSESSSTWQPAETWEEVRKVIHRWVGEARREGTSLYMAPRERHEDVISRSSFGGMEIHRIPYRNEWNVEIITGYLHSMSFCSPLVLGDKMEAFERDLRGTLLRTQPLGEFVEAGSVEAILAWKTRGDLRP